MAKREAIPSAIRDKLLVDALHRCCLCPEHQDISDLHHIVLVSEGGPNTEDNLIVVCPTCHAKIHRIRSRYTVKQLRMYKERWIQLCALGLPLDTRLAHAFDYTKPPTSLIPPAPAAHLAHPYPMPKHWTGRLGDMDRLDAWLKGDGEPMCCLVAYGGMGKSSLSWNWLENQVVPNQQALGLDGIFQWSFYEGEVSFQRFLEDLGVYLGISSATDPVTAITQHLGRKRILLVLDGFERLLCAYASVDAALLPERTADELQTGQRRCADMKTVRFLRSLVTSTASKSLLISRLVPEELDGKEGWLSMELPGLDPADAVAFLRDSGIKGTDHELEAAAGRYAFHPLSLSKLVNVLRYDTHKPNDISQASEYDVTPDLRARQHHILQQAYETLPSELGQFLSAIAALRGKADLEVIQFLAGDWTDVQLAANLRRLDEDRWVQWSPDERTIDLHPVVRRYAYERLADKKGVHTRLRDYFSAVPTPDREKVQTLEDLNPVIELYHHTVRAGRYDEAYDLFHDRIDKPTYYRFGAYQLQIELLRALFPDGEDKPPRLKKESAQAWTLNALANSYALSGQPRRAVPLFEASNAIDEQRGNKKGVAIGLANLADDQIKLSEFAAAERNLRRSIELCREIEDESQGAVGHQELGRLLAYQGAFDEAEERLTTAQTFFDRIGTSGTNYVSVVRADRSLLALLMRDAKAALEAARQARELADEVAREEHPFEVDFVRAEWLLGAALTALAGEEKARRGERLAEAGRHLTEALDGCRGMNLVYFEPDILLAWARWHHVKGNVKEARRDAEEALSIADRCEYRLQQADIHNFLAWLDLEAGKEKEAVKHARIAHERAWCDGPPHCYKPALDEAKRLLEELGASPRG